MLVQAQQAYISQLEGGLCKAVGALANIRGVPKVTIDLQRRDKAEADLEDALVVTTVSSSDSNCI